MPDLGLQSGMVLFVYRAHEVDVGVLNEIGYAVHSADYRQDADV